MSTQRTNPNPDKEPNDHASADERNLVSAKEDLSEIEFDERVWLFWQRHRGTVITLLLAVFISVGVVFGMRTYKAHVLSTQQEAYLKALENDTLSLFAIEYADSTLAGTVWLQDADAAYIEEDFEKAANLYAKASERLGDAPLGTRAQLGHGMALYRQGNLSSARNAFAQVSGSETVLQTYRAHAHYLLAELALTENEPERALLHLDEIASLVYAGSWGTRAEVLRMNAPELKGMDSVDISVLKPATAAEAKPE